jgi:Mce-associated membrane protein
VIRRLVLPLVGLLVLAGVGIGTYAFLHRGSEDPDAAILVAARQGATDFFSLDYRHAGADVDRVLALATGSFKKQYAAQRTQIVDGVTSKKLVVTAVIPADGAGIEYRDPAHAQVLVAVDVTTAASASTGSSVQRYRARVLLTRVQGQWLISGLNQVG